MNLVFFFLSLILSLRVSPADLHNRDDDSVNDVATLKKMRKMRARRVG